MSPRLTIVSVTALLLFCAGVPSHVYAAENSLTLSVTPPLYQLNVTPGDLWKSTLKVINNNPFELTVYAEIKSFAPQGEDGQGRFLSREGGFDPEGPQLANWMDVTSMPIVIPPERSIEVPVSIVVPKSAAPGGHFAAILVGTHPPESSGESLVRTSQVVTSLFFLRVAGDIVETGSIRQFSVADLFHETPEAQFVLRFENTGNVHLQPQGNITISNMWGRERGMIPINQKSSFGNVLPHSIRKFDFSWTGERSLADIGRYTAEVTLTFGQNGRQNLSQITHFWVVPLKGALITLSILAAFLYFMVWAVRRYVRRALYLAGYQEPLAGTPLPKHARQVTQKNLILPLREGVLDLRKNVVTHDPRTSLWHSVVAYGVRYRFFFGAVVALALFVFLGVFYFTDVLRGHKAYEVTLNRGDDAVTLSSEEVLKDQVRTEGIAPDTAVTQRFSLFVIHETRDQEAGSALARRLEALGYTIASSTQQGNGDRTRSVIVYDAQFEAEALKLSNQLGGVPLSQTEGITSSTTEPGIHLFVGSDMLQ